MVIGDWGTGGQSQTIVANAMADRAGSHGEVAIITTGDNFYSDEAADLMAPLEWATSGGVPILISWGNHDIETGSRLEVVSESFGHPPRWYVVPWGALDLVFLDSNQIHSRPQARFLAETLAASERPAILIFHHPVYNCGRHGDTEAAIKTWVPLHDDDVVLVLNGHEHSYQRFEEGGVTYIVTGGGGRSLYDLETCPPGHSPLVTGAVTHHFLVVTSEGDELRVEAVDTDGTVFDTVEITLP